MTNLSDNYTIINEIGSGSFGSVYLVKDNSNDIYLAAKVEEKTKSTRLFEEWKIYKKLEMKIILNGIPKVYNFIKTPQYNILMMELLGKSLEVIFEENNNKFDMGTTLKLGIEIIKILECIHNAGFIHRDIKPSNFLLGYDDKSKIYIMDFGLSKKIINNGKHMCHRNRTSIVGTARFTSLNIHFNIEPTRRDDLESVGYMLIYFLKGKLPWQGLKKKEGLSQIEHIGEVKSYISINKLCAELPECFCDYVNYCRDLKYDEKPNYEYLIKLFLETSEKYNIKLRYFWCN
jgi:serine/threonine protein kinase